jgi:acyl-ACP thioesterase
MPFSPDLVPRPARGRVFERDLRVRLADVSPADRLRFDAAARYLQDIARDDSADADLENPMGWVVRRTVIEVARPLVFQEATCLATWCSGIGARWAERRTSIRGEHGGAVEAVTVWVHVDPRTGRPARLVDGFAGLYAEAAGGRGADARLSHPAQPPRDCGVQPWPLRAADFDVLGHVNNAAYVAAVEDAIGDRAELWSDVRVELEYRDPVLPGAAPELAVRSSDGGVELWMCTDAMTNLTASVRPLR